MHNIRVGNKIYNMITNILKYIVFVYTYMCCSLDACFKPYINKTV